MPFTTRLIPALFLLPGLAAGLACRPSAEARAQEGTALVRSMDQDLLAAQKKIIGQFKAMPEADSFRMALDTGIDTWDVSEKKLAANEDAYEQALIGFQKDAREEALIGEYRLYTKKLQQGAQDLAVDYESRSAKTRKELADGNFIYQGSPVPLNETGKRIRQAVLAILPLEIQLENETRTITAGYETKLAKLLR